MVSPDFEIILLPGHTLADPDVVGTPSRDGADLVVSADFVFGRIDIITARSRDPVP